MIAGATLMAVLLAATAAGAGAAPLTNEDIVRMTMAGWAPERIVEAIQQAPDTSFDLDPEMIQELREAGVDEAVLRAMKSAQAAPAEPGEDAPSSRAGVTVTLRLTPPAAPDAAAGQPPWVEMPVTDPNGGAVQAALLLVCTDPTHVPDEWHSSPFGSDLGRNHLLWHASGTRPKEGDTRVVRMDLPSSVPILLEPGEHPIRLMLAVRPAEGAWEPLAFSEGRLTTLPGTPVVVTAVVSGRLTGRRTRTSGFTCRLAGSEPADALVLTPEKDLPRAP